MAAPNFVTIDTEVIVSELVAFYESETGRTLQPAQVERLLIQAMAYREALILNAIQSAATMQLVNYSVAPFLDELGALVGVTRLGAAEATCRLQLTLVTGHGALVIPQGLRFASTDGQVVFTNDEPITVVVGTDVYTVNATCQTEGVAGNGYTAGTIVTIIDPQAYLSAATNIDTTAGGSEVETDELLRERIKLAPSAFSVAGPTNAYKYWAKTANPNIIDVAVISPSPGVVDIFPLMSGGIATPQSVLDAVYGICNADDIRPLTDLVYVKSPTPVPYDISVELTLLETADQQSIITTVTAALETYKLQKQTQLGKDVIINAIRALCMVTGVYNVNILLPLADTVIDGSSFAQCNSITVTVVGLNEG